MTVAAMIAAFQSVCQTYADQLCLLAMSSKTESIFRDLLALEAAKSYQGLPARECKAAYITPSARSVSRIDLGIAPAPAPPSSDVSFVALVELKNYYQFNLFHLMQQNGRPSTQPERGHFARFVADINKLKSAAAAERYFIVLWTATKSASDAAKLCKYTDKEPEANRWAKATPQPRHGGPFGMPHCCVTRTTQGLLPEARVISCTRIATSANPAKDTYIDAILFQIGEGDSNQYLDIEICEAENTCHLQVFASEVPTSF